MWIVGPGEMVSENTSRGIREPRTHGKYVTVEADNWLFHFEPAMVDRIQFVETHGDLKSYYVRFADRADATLFRAYIPRPSQEGGAGEPLEGNRVFDEMRGRHAGMQGVEPVSREVHYPAKAQAGGRSAAGHWSWQRRQFPEMRGPRGIPLISIHSHVRVAGRSRYLPSTAHHPHRAKTTGPNHEAWKAAHIAAHPKEVQFH